MGKKRERGRENSVKGRVKQGFTAVAVVLKGQLPGEGGVKNDRGRRGSTLEPEAQMERERR